MAPQSICTWLPHQDETAQQTVVVGEHEASARAGAARPAGGVTGTWRERLPTDQIALFLVPVEPGTSLRGSGWLRPMWMPGFGSFELHLGPETALAITATVWLETVAPELFPAIALAPPVLERYAAGRLDDRAIVAYGLEYPLPPAAM